MASKENTKQRMMDRLDSFVSSKPRRSSNIIIALVIVIVAMLVAFAIDAGGFLRAPHPSEDTPLSVTAQGVQWNQTESIRILYGGGVSFAPFGMTPSEEGWGLNYSTFWFYWQLDFEATASGLSGRLVWNPLELEELASGSEATVRVPFEGGNPGGTFVDFYIDVTDLTGNGTFDAGDTFTFGPLSFLNDNRLVSTVGIASLQPSYNFTWEFSFTIHDGKLYSWRSDDLNVENPWWVH